MDDNKPQDDENERPRELKPRSTWPPLTGVNTGSYRSRPPDKSPPEDGARTILSSERERDAEADPATERERRIELARTARLEKQRHLDRWKIRRARVRAVASTRRVRAAAFVVVVAVSALAALHALSADSPSAVSGHLNQIGAISFTAGAQRDGGISPVCGCLIPPVDAWRGVAFASRSLTLSRSGPAPFTTWFISSPEPASIRFFGALKRLDVDVVHLRLHGREFQSRWMLHPESLHRHGTVIDRRVVRHQFLNLITSGELHVSLLGPAPIAAWIPFPGSRVTIDETTSPFPDDPSTPRLTERYPKSIGDAARTQAERAQQYPLGDFLGPDVVLWSDDPGARVFGGTPAIPQARQPGGVGDVITAMRVRRSVFSTRIAVLPLQRDAFRGFTEDLRQHPSEARRNVGFIEDSDGGAVDVFVHEPLASKEYIAIRKRLARHPVTTTTAYEDITIDDAAGNRTRQKGPVRQTQRYPPIPANAGLNLFGPMPELTLKDARGTLVFGDRSVDLGAPSLVELRRIEAMRRIGPDATIPLPLSAARHRADLQFTGVSEVAVNGENETSYARRRKSLLEALSFIVGVGAALFAMLSVIQAFRRQPASA